MLGVPLGDDAFVSDFVDKKLLGRLQETVLKLVAFEDSQAATYLLRVSYSIVRAVHFMRTTPLAQWKEQGVKFDGMVRGASEKILGIPMSDRTFAQAALTPKLGGLGLRRTVEHADFAYSASWHESMKQAKETWTRPPKVEEKHVSQSQASYQFDEAMFNYLVDSAPDEREKQRLLRVAQPHAGGFVTATPSEEDGKDTILRPRIFRTAIKYRLGVAVLSNETPCPMCMQTIDVYGDHATCCARNGDLIARHNAVRNLVNSIAGDGLLNPVLEKKGILGPTSGRRPGDVTIPNWSHGIGLAIDVAVTCPLIESNVRLDDPGEEYGEKKKHRKYDASFAGTDYTLCAMVFETFGAVNEEGEVVLKQLFSFAAKELGREFTSFCSRAWARMSCCLQRSVAQSILSRIDGNSSRPSRTLQEPSLGEPSVGEPGPSVGEPKPLVLRSPVSSVSRPHPVPFSPGVPPEIPKFPCPYPSSPPGLFGWLRAATKHQSQVGSPEVFQGAEVSSSGLRRALSCEKKGGLALDLGSPDLVFEEGERKGGGKEAGGLGVSVVSVVCSSRSSSRKIGTATLNMKKDNTRKKKKYRDVGPGARKKTLDNSYSIYIKKTKINPCSTISPVVRCPPKCSRSPHHTVSHTHNHTDAGGHRGMSGHHPDNREPNEAAYGPHKCRSAGVIVERKKRA